MSALPKQPTRTERQMMKALDKQKAQMQLHADKIRRRSNIMGLGLGILVVGIYAYTITRMGQDKFLDDDKPMLVKDQPSR